MKFPLLTFNSGELSPQIDARSDIDKYRAGCRILENMIPRIYGPATRRPGTKYIDTCNGVSRVIPFIYSNTIAYILLLEDQKMWFYYNGGQVLDTWGRRLYIDTPYLESDLFELQYKQSNDVMWIVHPRYAPRKLTRTSANSFNLDTITFNNGPFKKRNDILEDDDVTLTPSVTTGSGNLTASSATFNSGHVGALFNVTHPRVNTAVSGHKKSTGVLGGSSILTEGPCTLNLSDGWAGTVQLQRSIDDGSTWEVRRSFFSNDGKRSVQYTFNEEEENVLHRIYISELEDSYNMVISITDEEGYVGEETIERDSEVSGDLTVNSSTQTGRCRITAFTSSTQVSMTVLKDFASTNADTRWAEGCWSAYRGYPSSMTFFEERAVYAATPYQPQTIWLSGTDDYEDFLAGTNDDDSFSLTISSETRNAIQWIAALESILIGTSGGEWRAGSTTEGEPITPTNFSIKQQSSYGSKYLQAQQVGDVVLFADFVGRKVRELTFSGDKYKYVAPDMTALAEHITETGIVGMAFQRNPDPILWSFRDDGTLLSMTYEREQNVIAWSRHPFLVGGDAESQTTLTTPTYRYPVLQELTDAEIPDTPAEPADIPLESAISVTDSAGLQAMTLGNHYVIDADIDLTGVTWTPLDFSGASDIVIEGNNHTISNLTINKPTTNDQGLIGQWNGGGQIRNITFSNCSVIGQTYVSIFCARTNLANKASIKNVNFTSCNLDIYNHGGILVARMWANKNMTIYGCSASDCIVTCDDVSMACGILFDVIGASANYNNYSTNVIDCHVNRGILELPVWQTVSFGTFASQIGGGGTTAAQTNLFLYECTSSGEIIAGTTSIHDLDIAVNISDVSIANPCVITLASWPAGLTDGDVIVMYNITGTEGAGGATVEDLNGIAYNATSCNENAKTLSLLYLGDSVDTSNCDTYTGGGTLQICSPNNGIIGGGFAWSIGNTRCVSCSMGGKMTIKTDSSWTAGDNIQTTGGFAGSLTYGTELIDCNCSGDIIFEDGGGNPGLAQIGGFVGMIYSHANQIHLLRCYSTSEIQIETPVSGVGNLGGFVGQVLAFDDGYKIERCWAEGDITFSGSIAADTGSMGGFAGRIEAPTSEYSENSPTVENCYTWSSIITVAPFAIDPYPSNAVWVGGFVGAASYSAEDNYYSVQNCYCAQTNSAAGSGLTNQLPPDESVYGFGSSNGEEESSDTIFFDTQTSGNSSVGMGDGHVALWMMTKSNYVAAGWDFDTIWYIPDDTTQTVLDLGLGVNSAAVIPGSTEDEVWLVVSRYINGSVVRYLEQMQPRSWGSDDEDQWFLDSALDYDSTATTTFSGLDHLEGEEVAILADGAVVGNKTVTNGAITLTNAASRVIVGLPFRYKLKPMRVDLTGGINTSQTVVGRIGEMVVSFYKSGNVEFGVDTDHLFKVDWRTTEDYDSPPTLYTGDKKLELEGGYDAQDPILITGNSPLACTIRAMVPRKEITGR